jgi:AraC-like DNA-binding protein
VKRREVEIIQKDGRILVRFARDTFPVALTKIAREGRFNATELCTRLGVSERNLRRIFESGLGIGAKEWLRQERMVVARNLLREGSPIKEVAVHLGFANYKNLNREFVAFYGVTPSDYQKRELTMLQTPAM